MVLNEIKMLEHKILTDKLICPICHHKLDYTDEKFLSCLNRDCKIIFPIVNGIPILINENQSLFEISDFIEYQKTTLNIKKRSALSSKLKRIIPSISRTPQADRLGYKKLCRMLSEGEKHVLVIGGSIKGVGIDSLYEMKNVNIIESDVSHGPCTKIIFDCHNIPYEDSVFDAVVCQAVLEHVLDPHQCVSEIYRVLKSDGLVYAQTPFVQQVHGGVYDFTRFTYLGHRYLFKNFSEIESGLTQGPATALAWSIQYFLKSFLNTSKNKLFIEVISAFFLFWLKYLDMFLRNRNGSFDAASGFYFLGRKSENILSGTELLKG